MENVIIIGASGELGQYVVRSACRAAEDPSYALGSVKNISVTFFSNASSLDPICSSAVKHKYQLNTSDPTAVERIIDESAFGIPSKSAVIYCALPKFPGSGAGESEAVKNGIVDDVTQAAKICFARGIRFVVLSTDHVFSGRPKGGEPANPQGYLMYTEQSDTSPVNAYGRYKVMMEDSLLNLAQETHAEHLLLICRTSMILTLPKCMENGSDDFSSIYNGSDLGGKMISFLLRTIIVEPKEEQKPVELFIDEPRNMSFAVDLADALVELTARTDAFGLLHLVSDEITNRYELALRLTARMKLKSCNNFTTGFSKLSNVVRPLDVTMSTSKLKSLQLKTQIHGVSHYLPETIHQT